jgi:hypothetical protein
MPCRLIILQVVQQLHQNYPCLRGQVRPAKKALNACPRSMRNLFDVDDLKYRRTSQCQHALQVFGGTSGTVSHVINLAKARALAKTTSWRPPIATASLQQASKKPGVVTLGPPMFRRVEHKIAHWERRSKMRKVSKLARFPFDRPRVRPRPLPILFPG